MLIYLETKAKSYSLTQRILAKFPSAQVLEIDHYKNIFDKNIGTLQLEPAIILAVQDHIPILSVPENYWRPGKSFFFKTSLNCVYDCEYCYLKANFKTQHSVIFVNYDEIKQKIQNQILSLREEGYQWPISFYASNYSDIQWIDMLTEFNQTFIPLSNSRMFWWRREPRVQLSILFLQQMDENLRSILNFLFLSIQKLLFVDMRGGLHLCMLGFLRSRPWLLRDTK